MRRTEEIYANMSAKLAADSGMPVPEGGELSLRLHAVAAEIFSLEAQADYIARQSFPQTAQGEALDRHGALRGIARMTAAKATGRLCFSVSAARDTALQVPAGTECRTAAGTAFVTTEAGVIAAGETECTVAAEAAEPGTGGNIAAGTVQYMILPPVGVQHVNNPANFTGGCDTETDEALRERILASYRRLPNGANAAYYESRVRQHPGTAEVLVLPKVRGTGTVDIVFSTQAGIPTSEEIAVVQAELNAEREISVDILVRAPEAVRVDVEGVLTTAAGYEFSEVAQRAQRAVQTFFSGKKMGKAVYRAALEALLMGVDGVENCCLTEPSRDIPATAEVLPVTGNVHFGEAVT